jgi:hypothetical protein
MPVTPRANTSRALKCWTISTTIEPAESSRTPAADRRRLLASLIAQSLAESIHLNGMDSGPATDPAAANVQRGGNALDAFSSPMGGGLRLGKGGE